MSILLTRIGLLSVVSVVSVIKQWERETHVQQHVYDANSDRKKSAGRKAFINVIKLIK